MISASVARYGAFYVYGFSDKAFTLNEKPLLIPQTDIFVGKCCIMGSYIGHKCYSSDRVVCRHAHACTRVSKGTQY